MRRKRDVRSITLTLSWRRPLSYRNQSIDLLCKSMNWFLYDNGPSHERVKPTLKLAPKQIVIHCGTNNLKEAETVAKIFTKTYKRLQDLVWSQKKSLLTKKRNRWIKCQKSMEKRTLHSFYKQPFAGVLQNSLKACNFIKKRSQNRCFPVNIAKFLRTALFIEHL